MFTFKHSAVTYSGRHIIIRLLLLAAAVALPAEMAQAQQWSPNGNDIYNTNSGHVGVGTTTPAARLHVVRSTANNVAISGRGPAGEDVFNQVCIEGVQCTYWGIDAATNNTILGRSVTKNDVVVTANGNVGIGVTNPSVPLQLNWPGIGIGGGNIAGRQISITSGTYSGISLYTTGGGGFGWTIDNHGTNDAPYNRLGFYSWGAGEVFSIAGSGNVGIGTTAPSSKLHVEGDVTVTGNISAKYQDVAEWVPAAHPIAPGVVVILDPQVQNSVLPSTRAYDTSVAGVISAEPGIVLGERGENKVKVATTGRVRVRVDATRNAIRIGDLLVTSDKEGVAMRSEPLDIGGRKIHQPGTLIGKALEPLSEGEGEILVLLSLQ